MTSSSSGERAYVLTSSSLYGQYLQLELLAEARGCKKESLHTVTVNLFRRNIEVSLPAHLIQGGGVDPALVVKRKCSLKMPI